MRSLHRFLMFLSLALLAVFPVRGQQTRSEQFSLTRIAQMPYLPAPYQIRDWNQVTKDYVRLFFDTRRSGEYLPLIQWKDKTPTSLGVPSYLGGRGGPEAINYLAAVLSGALVGQDMTRYQGYDWTKLCEAFFSSEDGIYVNNFRSRVSGSFWYDLLPNLLVYQIADRTRNSAAFQPNLKRIAEQWYRACVAMGGKTQPFALPDFDHTGFQFAAMTPFNNGRWLEPDAAAGIAWLEYMAYTRFKDPRYLTAADWCLRALERRPVEKNPLYETLLPYGAFLSARVNAEVGRDYDVHKLLNWCFEPGDSQTARPSWGVLTRRFGAFDCHGLVGSVTDTDGYAFAMNSFEWAGALTPLVRYDTRFADTVGKWMVNLVSAARLFYPASLPAVNQDRRAWSDRYDPANCLPYEGLRGRALRFASEATDVSQTAGRRVSGSDTALRRLDNSVEELATARDPQGRERLEHIWRVLLPHHGEHILEIYSRCLPASPPPVGFHYLWARTPDGPYQPLFEVTETDQITWHSGPLPETESMNAIYLKVVSREGGGHQTLQVDQIRVRTLDAALSPFATGDALGWGGPSNLCLYGGSHVGLLGALVKTTSDPAIPRFDLLATDWYHARAYPTYLLYNPFPNPRRITFALGSPEADIYDAVSHRFLRKRASKTAALTLLPHRAIVAVIIPSGGAISRLRGQLRVNDIAVDYRVQTALARHVKP